MYSISYFFLLIPIFECRKSLFALKIFIFSPLCFMMLNSNMFRLNKKPSSGNLEYQIRKDKVKVTLVQALRLCTDRTAHRGSRGIAVPFHDHGTRRGWGVSFTPRPLFTPGKGPIPIVQEAGWAPGPAWTGADNLAPTRIPSPDRPTRSESLYRLSDRGPHQIRAIM